MIEIVTALLPWKSQLSAFISVRSEAALEKMLRMFLYSRKLEKPNGNDDPWNGHFEFLPTWFLCSCLSSRTILRCAMFIGTIRAHYWVALVHVWSMSCSFPRSVLHMWIWVRERGAVQGIKAEHSKQKKLRKQNHDPAGRILRTSKRPSKHWKKHLDCFRLAR